MRIATWNVNSVKARLSHVLDYLRQAAPDVLLLQELKVVDEAFPALEIEDLGYNLAVHGQKTYNGVAILSRFPLQDIVERLPGDETDKQARYVEAWVDAGADGVRVASIYLPNGNPVDSEKYPYKLAWMVRLREYAASLLTSEEPVVLAGDYNVIPAPGDVYDPAGWAEDALFRLDTRRAFRKILNLGYTEAFRALHAETGRYSFWDYQRRAFESDRGLRIDHLLLSPQAADRLNACDIDMVPRGKSKASDHTPVWCELESAT
ncbi:MAG: exodeoxyribonuclease III [Alphaproteobacteria bacterium]|nr:exodeoxyribonuclease III [Alphaproteobacteria bacterium]